MQYQNWILDNLYDFYNCIPIPTIVFTFFEQILLLLKEGNNEVELQTKMKKQGYNVTIEEIKVIIMADIFYNSDFKNCDKKN
jgi:hypothetical protein